MSSEKIKLPSPPDGYRWRIKGSPAGPGFEHIQLVEKRWYWKDKVIYDTFLDVALRYPVSANQEFKQAADLAFSMEEANE